MVVLGLVTIHCHPVLVSPPHGTSLLPPHGMSTSLHIIVTSLACLVAVLLLSCVVVFVLCCYFCCPVLCPNEVGWEEHGMGGTYLKSTTMNNECCCCFGCHIAVSDVAPAFPVRCGQLFPSMGGCFLS